MQLQQKEIFLLNVLMFKGNLVIRATLYRIVNLTSTLEATKLFSKFNSVNSYPNVSSACVSKDNKPEIREFVLPQVLRNDR